MKIIISNKSKQPIYDQIITQIKEQILSGELKEGDTLPSMRQFAKSLRVSVITVQKAYETLQREGFIDSAVGRGTFIAEQDIDKIRNEYLLKIEECLNHAITIAKNSSVEMEELKKLLDILIQEGGN